MFRIGAHVSIAGGIPKAVDRAVDLGGNCGQVFVGSPRGWATSEVEDAAAEAFITASEEADVGPWIVHGTYLINFATPKSDLAEKSVAAVQAELEAAAALEIPYYVFHPGSHTGAGVETGIENVAARLDRLAVPDGVTVLLENTAGSGTALGADPGDLAAMIDGSDLSGEDVGVCLDTCHLYAAGHDFTSDDGLDELIAAIDETVGLEAVEYCHLNDSKHPLGSHKDEHEHIGEGEIGPEGFRRFINHAALEGTPMVLETPEDEKGHEWNLQRCRELRK